MPGPNQLPASLLPLYHQIPRAASAAAVEVPASVPIGQLPAEQRQALADQWGYKTIGAELPDGVTLTDIVKSMPPEVSLLVWLLVVMAPHFPLQ